MIDVKKISQIARDAERFRYLALLELDHTEETSQLRGCDYIVFASDGKTFFGKTYEEAVDRAMEHDKANLFFRP